MKIHRAIGILLLLVCTTACTPDHMKSNWYEYRQQKLEVTHSKAYPTLAVELEPVDYDQLLPGEKESLEEVTEIWGRSGRYDDKAIGILDDMVEKNVRAERFSRAERLMEVAHESIAEHYQKSHYRAGKQRLRHAWLASRLLEREMAKIYCNEAITAMESRETRVRAWLAAAHMVRGWIDMLYDQPYEASDRLEEAQRQLPLIVRDNGIASIALHSFCRTQVLEGASDFLIDSVDMLLNVSPMDATGLSLRGVVMYEDGSYDLAVKSLLEAARLPRDDCRELGVFLMLAALRADRVDDVKTELAEIVAHPPMPDNFDTNLMAVLGNRFGPNRIIEESGVPGYSALSLDRRAMAHLHVAVRALVDGDMATARQSVESARACKSINPITSLAIVRVGEFLK